MRPSEMDNRSPLLELKSTKLNNTNPSWLGRGILAMDDKDKIGDDLSFPAMALKLI